MGKLIESLEKLIKLARMGDSEFDLNPMGNIDDIEENYKIIKLALQSRPITSDEICEATSCIGHKVTYDKNRKLFSSKYHLVAQLTVDGLRIGFHFKPSIAHKITTFFMEVCE